MSIGNRELMYSGHKMRQKVKGQKEISIKENRMIYAFQSYKLLGSVVKIIHINHMTIMGVLKTIKPSVPQKFCVQNCLIKYGNDGTVKFKKKVSISPINIISFEVINIEKDLQSNKLREEAPKAKSNGGYNKETGRVKMLQTRLEAEKSKFKSSLSKEQTNEETLKSSSNLTKPLSPCKTFSAQKSPQNSDQNPSASPSRVPLAPLVKSKKKKGSKKKPQASPQELSNTKEGEQKKCSQNEENIKNEAEKQPMALNSENKDAKNITGDKLSQKVAIEQQDSNEAGLMKEAIVRKVTMPDSGLSSSCQNKQVPTTTPSRSQSSTTTLNKNSTPPESTPSPNTAGSNNPSLNFEEEKTDSATRKSSVNRKRHKNNLMDYSSGKPHNKLVLEGPSTYFSRVRRKPNPISISRNPPPRSYATEEAKVDQQVVTQRSGKEEIGEKEQEEIHGEKEGDQVESLEEEEQEGQKELEEREIESQIEKLDKSLVGNEVEVREVEQEKNEKEDKERRKEEKQRKEHEQRKEERAREEKKKDQELKQAKDEEQDQNKNQEMKQEKDQEQVQNQNREQNQVEDQVEDQTAHQIECQKAQKVEHQVNNQKDDKVEELPFEKNEKYLDLDSVFNYENFYNPSHKQNLSQSRERMESAMKKGKYFLPNLNVSNNNLPITQEMWENYQYYFWQWEHQMDHTDFKNPLFGLDPMRCAHARQYTIDRLPPPLLFQFPMMPNLMFGSPF
ncbi:unnamed protein product [Moneuplotes crassus]|uniref:Uncharacterized protein n=2 Tax=Euplotes crassus TaxID=5936 RepID=A0AAD2DAZ6_EUPCR|nr:unnamed protein product [Moneuplotes crassus]